MMKKDSYDEPFYMKIFSYAYFFLMLNVLFTLVNLPLFLTTTSLAIDYRNTLFFFIASLPIGSVVISLIGALDDFYESKEIKPLNQFFDSLKKFWLSGLIYWIANLILGTIFLVDIVYFSNTSFNRLMIPFLMILFLISLGTTLNCCYFQVRNPEKGIFEIIKFSFFYTLKKWYLSLVNVFLFLGMMGLIVVKPQFGYMIGPSILLFLLYLNCQQLHK